MWLKKIKKITPAYLLIIILGISINTSTMSLPYKVAAISTLDTLEFESNQTKQGTYFTVGKYPSAIAVDEGDDTVYVANSDSDTVSVIDGDTLGVKRVPVGDYPISIAIDGIDHMVYVANSDSDTVSVIDGYTLDVTQVPVGDYPISIAVHEVNSTVYVANSDSGTVSVIDGSDFTNMANITVDCCPSDIVIDEDDNRAYVADYESNSISVIDGYNPNVTQVHFDCCIHSIAVNEIYNELYVGGLNMTSPYVSKINGTLDVSEFSVNPELAPLDIAVDQDDDIVYATDFDRRVSVMDGISLEPQSGVSFNADPFHAGHIECSGKAVPTNHYFYFDFRTPCKAQANKGFEFLSWEENLDGNSTRIIKISQPASPLDSILDFFGISKPEEPEATLSTTKSGTFTANFKELPPAIPPEYLATLFAVVISTFIGSWLTPTFIGWRRTKKQGNKLNYYFEKIKYLCEDGKLDKDDTNSLDKLRDNITDDYSRGKINKEQLDKLVHDISISYQEIFRKEIDCVMITSSEKEKDKERELNEIRLEIEDACAKGKISELHYNLLGKKIEFLLNTNRTTSDNMKRSQI